MNEYPGVRRYRSSRKPTAPDKKIGQRIRWCRHVKGMTLATLAGAISISLQQLAKYESGGNKIHATRLESIARILRVSTEELTQESPFEAALSELGLGLGDLLHDPLLIRLLQAWVWIECSEQRSILLQLIKTLDPANAARPKGEVQPS